jgi:hypothetical protein
MPRILDGVSNIIDQALGLRSIGERLYKHSNKQAWVLLCKLSEPDRNIDVGDLFQLVSARIAANRRELTDRCIPCRGTKRNWRFEVQPKFQLAVKYELRLQKAIAILLEGHWANAVPTASGISEYSESSRCIDLVERLSEEEWRFVELKALENNAKQTTGERTPLFACLELLQYALIFRYSKEHSTLLGYTKDKNPVIAARTVHLEVLMTRNCYFHNPKLGRLNIEWLHKLMNDGLRSINEKQPDPIQFDFCFSEFPKDFEWTENDHRLLHSLLETYQYPKRKAELIRDPNWLSLQGKIKNAVSNRVAAPLS